MTYRLEEIASITGSTLTGRDCRIERVITDSRNPYDPAATLFVAIRGNNHDGHAFIRSLYAGGVRAFLTDTDIDTAAYPEAGFVRCPDSVAALQRLATYHRNRFRGTVVAITGSNGKTVTKEWIAQLCPPGVKLFRSPRSYNSQIGVALSLLMLDGDERLAIIEAGISEPGEMERLERMIRPDVGIFTNLGDAHQEHFSDLGQKLNEKLILFRQAQTIIYNASAPTVAQRIRELYGDRQLAGVTPQSYDLSTLPFSDGASRENAAEAIALYDVLGFDRQPVLASLPTLQSVAMRMELKEGICGCKLVNDSYNSDINSLALSLDYLVSVAGGQPKILILSDIRQSGLPAEKLYEQVAALLRTKGIDTLIGIGKEIVQHAASFGCDKAFYRNTDEFLRSYNRTQFVNKSILLKGSRAFGFEKISHALEQRTHTTVLEVESRQHDSQPQLFPVSARSGRTHHDHGQSLGLRHRHLRSSQHAPAPGGQLSRRGIRRRRGDAARGGHHDAGRRAECRFGQFRNHDRLRARTGDLQFFIARSFFSGRAAARRNPLPDPPETRYRDAPPRFHRKRHRRCGRRTAEPTHPVHPLGVHASGRQR